MKHRWTNFLSILVDFRSVGKVCEPLKVLRLPAKTRVRLSALQVESRTHFNLEKVRKSGPKRRILQHFEPVGPHSAEILSNFGRNSNEGCARLIQVRAFAVGRPRAIEFRAILVEIVQFWTNIVGRTPQASYENLDIDIQKNRHGSWDRRGTPKGGNPVSASQVAQASASLRRRWS